MREFAAEASDPQTKQKLLDLAEQYEKLVTRANERAMTRDHLEQAQRHVVEGDRHIVRQCELIADLERGGHDTHEARALLLQYEDIQVLFVSDRDRLQAKLAALLSK